MDERLIGREIASILRHEVKNNTYKFALVRAINDVVMAYPDACDGTHDVAVPLRRLASQWLAYYWAFADEDNPVWQGPRNQSATGLRQDMVFRRALKALRREWETYIGAPARPSDGFTLISEIASARGFAEMPVSLRRAYERAVREAVDGVKQPIRYVGPGSMSILPQPRRFRELEGDPTAIPGTRPDDVCLAISAKRWEEYRRLSMWVEAACIHEWSLFVETVDQTGGAAVSRGEVYRLLTDRPDNRRPLTWERNKVDMLLREGQVFTCPWTGKRITLGTQYDVDHLVPLAVYPTNELWNLAPSDRWFNEHRKRARLPSDDALARAYPALVETYTAYSRMAALGRTLRDDVSARFTRVNVTRCDFPRQVADAVSCFIRQLAAARNVARFEWGGRG
ncbi:MAG TPA: hypothetical protein GX714_15410 [Chloroflexi bacterium]|nr:hypothetical protein [Chloroflexota bacterium]